MANGFIDKARITCRAGNGGNGAVAFHREKYIAAGGPDGGDGGDGGSIILQVDDNMSTLMDFRYKRKYVASNGVDGQGGRKSGKDGQSLIIRVPRGTLVRDAETNEIIKDMSGDEPYMLASNLKDVAVLQEIFHLPGEHACPVALVLAGEFIVDPGHVDLAAGLCSEPVGLAVVVSVAVGYEYSLKVLELQAKVRYAFNDKVFVGIVGLHAVDEYEAFAGLQDEAAYHLVAYERQLIEELCCRNFCRCGTEVGPVRIGLAP